MGRKVAIPWHAIFSIGAGVLYFFFVLPRWPELMGDTSHGLGTTLRIVTGALIGLAALPVLFHLVRTRRPELGVPQLALSLRKGSIGAHILSGVLIIGTAISEIWFSLDAAGRYLFAIYGAAAAIALLGFFAFYLSFIAELPLPAPKPIKAKTPKKSRGRKKDREKNLDGSEAADAEETEEAVDEDDAEADEADEAETPEESEEPAVVGAEATESPEAESDDEPDDPRGGLRNRRPTGKGSHRMRRRRTQGGIDLDE